MDIQSLVTHTEKVQETTKDLLIQVDALHQSAQKIAQSSGASSLDPFIVGLTVFILSCFVGYYVVWKVTPALHSPLMAVTNAISSVIIVGALIAAGPSLGGISTAFGFLGIVLASINIFGGFIVTYRMLEMFSRSK